MDNFKNNNDSHSKDYKNKKNLTSQEVSLDIENTVQPTSLLKFNNKVSYSFPNTVGVSLESIECPPFTYVKELFENFGGQLLSCSINISGTIEFLTFISSFCMHTTLKGKLLNLTQYCMSIKDKYVIRHLNILTDWFNSNKLTTTSGLSDAFDFLSSEFYTQSTKLIAYISYIFMFDKLTSSRLKAFGLMDMNLSKKLEKGRISLVDFVKDIVKFIDSAYKKLKGESIESDKDANDYIIEASFLVNWKEKTTYIKPIPDDMMSHEVWSSRVHRALALRNGSLSFKCNPALQFQMNAADRNLRICKDKLLLIAAKNRFPSYTVGLFGGTGTGKSETLVPTISRVLVEAAGIEFYDGCHLNLSMSSKHLDNYNNTVLVGVYDDMGATAPKNQPNFVYDTLLELLADNPVNVPGAAIEDKGKRYYNPIGNILTSNYKDFGTGAQGIKPEAFNRRMNLYIEVSLKGGHTENIDNYSLKLMRWSIKDNQHYVIIHQGKEMSGISLRETLDYISEDCKTHWASKKVFKDRLQEFSHCSVCSKYQCSCSLSLTADEGDASYYEFWYRYKLWLLTNRVTQSILIFPNFITNRYIKAVSNAERDYGYIVNYMNGRPPTYIFSFLSLIGIMLSIVYYSSGDSTPEPQGVSKQWILPKQTVTSKARIPSSDLLRVSAKNLRIMECVVKGKTNRTHVFGLYSNVFVGPAHTILSIDKDTAVTLWEFSCDENKLVKKCHIINPEVSKHKSDLIDLAFIRFSTVRPVADLRKYLPNQHGPDVEGKTLSILESGFQKSDFNGVLLENKVRHKKLLGYIGSGSNLSYHGQCGSPLILEGSGAIMGFNTAGRVNTNTMVFTPLLKEDIPVFVDAPYSDSLEFTHSKMQEASKHPSVMTYLPEHLKLTNSLTFLRTYRPAPQRAVSRVRRTSISNDVIKRFPYFDHDLVTPIFSPVHKPEFKSPEKHALISLCSQADKINTNHLQIVVKHLIDKFDSKVFDNDRHIDVHTAINGEDGHVYFKSLDMNTSGGFGYEGPKKNHLHFHNGLYYPNQRINDDIDYYLKCYNSNNRANVVYGVAIKDECRPLHKVEDRNLRVFNTAPLPFLIMFKQYFAGWIGCFIDLKNQAETVSGRNMFSTEWTNIYEHVSKHPNLFMGDFSKYDKRISSVIIEAVFAIIIGIKRRHNKISEEEEIIIKGLITDTCFPNYAFKGTCLGVSGSNPSGHYLTFIINNIANSIYIRLCWLSLDFQLSDFEKHVSFIACGDDNLGSVSDKYKEEFNFETIKNYFNSIGLSYTTIAKDNSSYKTLPLEKASICKRKFVWDKEYKLFRCPIELPSIAKMLTMTDDASSVSESSRLTQTFISAQIEFAQHGCSFFKEHNDAMLDIYNKHQIPIPKASKTYENILTTMASNGIAYYVGNDLNCDDHQHANQWIGIDQLSRKSTLQATSQRPIQEESYLARENQIASINKDLVYTALIQQRSGRELHQIPASNPHIVMAMTDAVLQTREEQSQNNDNQGGDHTVTSEPTLVGQPVNEIIGDGNVSTTATQTAHFTNKSDVQGANVVVDSSYLGGKTTNLAPLKDILSRPVQVHEEQFGPADFGTSFAPLTNFIGSGMVSDKINNFAYIRFSLKLKLVVNASQFQYGKYLVAWSPMRETKFEEQISLLVAQPKVHRYSTYPIKAYFHPGRQDSVEMDIPFMWRANYFDIKNDNFADYGRLHIIPVNNVNVANPTAPTTFDLKVYAWMHDVELNVATSALVPTSEIVDGKISGPASAVGNLASHLSHVPVIGPFAKATSIAAGAVSSVARLFGYSQPPYIKTPEFRRLELFQNMATTIGESTSQPLSLDPKCELSIDPSIAGWTRDDEMLVEKIVNREYYLGTSEWSITGGQFGPPYNTLIAEWDVTPMVYDTFNDGFNTYRHSSPPHFVGRMFRYWRGTMVYRVEVIASKYHSGALLIQFDPLVKDGARAPTNERETVVLDISKSTTIEIEVDFVYTKAYQTTDGEGAFVPLPSQVTYIPTSLAGSSIGAVTITELNQLVSPDSTSLAFVNVFSYMKNAEFADPQGDIADLDFTSEVIERPIKLTSSREMPNDTLEFMGERVLSLRSLLKRDNCYYSQYNSNALGQSFRLPLYPCVKGSDRLNTREFNSYLAYLSLAYVARRGSVKHKIVINNNNATHVEVERDLMFDDNVLKEDSRNFALITGGAVSVNSYQPSLDINIPYYYNLRFDEIVRPVFFKNNDRIEQQPTPYNEAALRYNLTVDVASDYTVKMYASAGEDFMLVCFLSAPNHRIAS